MREVMQEAIYCPMEAGRVVASAVSKYQINGERDEATNHNKRYL
jgi:hypothetical protein